MTDERKREQARRRARAEGADALLDDRGPDHCPYPDDTPEAAAWLDGWGEASDALRDL